MPKVNRSLCLFCQDYFCRSACPAEALTVYGEMTSVEDIISRVEKDEVFYNRSGGGLTVSGGEPLNQPEFLLNLLTEAKQRRLKTAMETTGAAEFGVLKEVSRLLDTVLYDVKIIDSFKHKEFTCLDNTLILNNLLKLAEIRDPQTIYVRTPVVPGFNDNPQAAAELGRFLAKIPGINFEPLPYHRLGEGKYGYLSRPYLMGAGTLTEKAAEIFGETVEKQRQAEDAFSGDLLEKKDFELIH
jgi:pyruvate formate lyase activating enzyme